MHVTVWIRRDGTAPSEPAVLTTDHPASSYGLPVVVLRGEALGPAELGGELVIEDPSRRAAPKRPATASRRLAGRDERERLARDRHGRGDRADDSMSRDDGR